MYVQYSTRGAGVGSMKLWSTRRDIDNLCMPTVAGDKRVGNILHIGVKVGKGPAGNNPACEQYSTVNSAMRV